MRRKAAMLVMVLCVMLCPSAAAEDGDGVARIDVFTIHYCPDCERVEELLRTYREEGRHELDVRFHYLDEPGVSEINAAVCDGLGLPESSRGRVPSVFSAEDALFDADITGENLSELIASAVGREPPTDLYASALVQERPPRRHWTPAPPPMRQPSAGRALLTFFSKHHCPACRRAEKTVEKVVETLGIPELDVRTVYVDYPEVVEANLAHMKRLGKGERVAVPALVGFSSALVAEAITEQAVQQMALEAEGSPPPEAALDAGAAERSALERRFRELTAGAVVAGGLADGMFNPCAFTVIVFFIAYLTHIGTTRRRILAAGATFMSAVFLTYMGLSVGLLRILMVGAALSIWLSYGLMLLTAMLVLTVSVVSFRDAAAIRHGRPGGMWLKLPDGARSFLHRRISRRARSGLTAGAMFALGAVVAAVELPCTGMMLVPIVVLLSWAAQVGEFGPAPYLWLVLYNLAFIFPLLVIFAAVYCGVTSEQLTSFFRRRLFACKILLGIVFLLLAVLLFALPFVGRQRTAELLIELL